MSKFRQGSGAAQHRLRAWGAAFLLPALLLGACELFAPPGPPRVTAVDPADGATFVSPGSNVTATVSLNGEGLDVTTLTPASVSLTDASGAEVEGARTTQGDAIVFDPAADLAADTSYTFSVTPEVRTASGTALQPYTSTFSTGNENTPGPGDGSLVPDRTPVVFTAGGSSSSDTRTLTLTNAGAQAVDVTSVSVGGAAADKFTLADQGSFTLEPGASQELSLTFTPGGDLGPQLATLTVTSTDAASPSLEIPLGGLGVEGQGGANEPSLQYILDTYGLGVDTGDEDPSTYNLVSAPTNGGVGSEVPGQYFNKAVASEPVTAQVLAAFGVENTPVVEFGYYTAGAADARTEVFDILSEPELNEQRLNPTVTATSGTVGADGTVTFEPGAGNFGLYSFWPTNRFFDERYVYTEDELNTFPNAIDHHVRTYPLVNPDGTVEPNAYVVATEEFTQGFDYNDVVVILRNVIPRGAFGVTPIPPEPPVPPANGVAGLTVQNALGLPYPDRLVLQKIENPRNKPCNPETTSDCETRPDPWAELTFPDTGTVTLQNTGSAALQLSLSIQNDNLFVINGPTTLTLQPGASQEVSITFNPQEAEVKGVYPAGLLVQAGGQQAGIELRGLYLLRPEGSREVFLGPMVNDLFGYNVDLGTNANGGISNPEADSSLAGEEVRSDYWQAADPSSPVEVLQLAAFQTCCTLGNSFRVFQLVPQGSSSPLASMVYEGAYSQSIFPLTEDGDLTQLSASTSDAFDIRVAGYSSNPDIGNGNGRLGVRFWPLKDRSGNTVPNSYIVAQDFVAAGCNGSGSGGDDDDANRLFPAQDTEPPAAPPTTPGANCDYNDHLYIIENVQPAN